MEFGFSSEEVGKEEVYIPKELELWAPLEEKPQLNEKEMSSILHEDEVIESLHIAIPSFLVTSENEKLGYYPCFDLDRYFIVGKLRQSPYMIFYEEKKSSRHMKKMLKEGFLKERSNYYLFDAFFEPFFGGAAPKYHLFQRVTFDTVPDAKILFRDIESEKPDFNQLFMS